MKYNIKYRIKNLIMIKCTRNNNRNIQYKRTSLFKNLFKVPIDINKMNFLGLHLFSLTESFQILQFFGKYIYSEYKY